VTGSSRAATVLTEALSPPASGNESAITTSPATTSDEHRFFGLALGVAAALVALAAPVLILRKKNKKVEEEKKQNGSQKGKGPPPTASFSGGIDDALYRKKAIPAAVAGSVFAAGLRISQMVVQSKVLGFLNVASAWEGASNNQQAPQPWDPTLVMVMMGGFLVSFVGYQLTESSHRVVPVVPPSLALKRPICHVGSQDYDDYDNAECAPRTFDACLPDSRHGVDAELLVGAALFGVGWGLAGYCPGPALYWAGRGDAGLLRNWWPAYWLGTSLASHVKGRTWGWHRPQQQQQPTKAEAKRA
jgi:uncharacterized membrane protein YedE/YeeE